MAAVVHHDAVAAESVRNGDRTSGSGVGQSSPSVGQTHRRIRKAVRVLVFLNPQLLGQKNYIRTQEFLLMRSKFD